MTTHTVPADVFDALAAGGGDILGVLRAGQRSKRLLLVHELITVTRTRAPELFAAARGDEALAVLTDAQRSDRHAVDGLLLHPHIGAWATHCLRRLLVDGELPPEDIGHLGAVAGSAALRAGRAFELRTYLRDGSIMFPTFGMAQLPRPRGWCEITSRSKSGGVEISVADACSTIRVDAIRQTVGWLPLRHLRSDSDGVTVDVELDDLDPFRGCGHLPATGRLPTADVDDWQAKLDEAWSLLVVYHRTHAESVATGLASIVPLQQTEAAAVLSASCHAAIGAMSMTPPNTPLSLALALVHEFQHNKLSALLDLVPLVDRSPDRYFYAPWRADPRPLRGLLQGTYAYLGLTCFWDTYRISREQQGSPAHDVAWAHFEFALGCEQVGHALRDLSTSGRFTAPGERFVFRMRRRLSDLNRRSVPVVPLAFARLACIDHRVSWRLRNLQPEADLVTAQAAAWLANRTCPDPRKSPSTVVDGDGPAPSNARLGLLRRRLALADQWQLDPAGATPADVHLVAGRFGQAACAYRAQLSADPDDLSSWAGLSLVSRYRRSPSAPMMTTRPEQVRALHRAIRERAGVTPDPEDLAAWMGATDTTA